MTNSDRQRSTPRGQTSARLTSAQWVAYFRGQRRAAARRSRGNPGPDVTPEELANDRGFAPLVATRRNVRRLAASGARPAITRPRSATRTSSTPSGCSSRRSSGTARNSAGSSTSAGVPRATCDLGDALFRVFRHFLTRMEVLGHAGGHGRDSRHALLRRDPAGDRLGGAAANLRADSARRGAAHPLPVRAAGDPAPSAAHVALRAVTDGDSPRVVRGNHAADLGRSPAGVAGRRVSRSGGSGERRGRRWGTRGGDGPAAYRWPRRSGRGRSRGSRITVESSSIGVRLAGVPSGSFSCARTGVEAGSGRARPRVSRRGWGRYRAASGRAASLGRGRTGACRPVQPTAPSQPRRSPRCTPASSPSFASFGIGFPPVAVTITSLFLEIRRNRRLTSAAFAENSRLDRPGRAGERTHAAERRPFFPIAHPAGRPTRRGSHGIRRVRGAGRGGRGGRAGRAGVGRAARAARRRPHHRRRWPATWPASSASSSPPSRTRSSSSRSARRWASPTSCGTPAASGTSCCLLVKPLRRVRWLLVPGVIAVGFLVNIPVISQTSTAVCIGPVVVPLMRAAGLLDADHRRVPAARRVGRRRVAEPRRAGVADGASDQDRRSRRRQQAQEYLPPLVFTQLAVSMLVFWVMSVWWEREARRSLPTAQARGLAGSPFPRSERGRGVRFARARAHQPPEGPRAARAARAAVRVRAAAEPVRSRSMGRTAPPEARPLRSDPAAIATEAKKRPGVQHPADRAGDARRRAWWRRR